MRKRDVISIYSSGLCELIFASLAFAIVVLLGLHLIAKATETALNASDALLLSWECIVLMALWPGQKFWTITRSTANGRQHSVIGQPTDEDLCAMHHRAAARYRNHLRD